MNIGTTLSDIRSFVRYCGQGSNLLWTPALRPYVGSVRAQERKAIDWCMQVLYP